MKSKNYEEFVEKFKPKLTTDDCYTPPTIYDIVADWVTQEYGVHRWQMVRPFKPGGDYKAEQYGMMDVVVFLYLARNMLLVSRAWNPFLFVCSTPYRHIHLPRCYHHYNRYGHHLPQRCQRAHGL